MAQPDDSIYMTRCLELARKAEGFTSPNPLVGAVIVHRGLIIGEGYHLKAGTPHAEVHAINSAADKTLFPDSTLYVNLEPCSHFGRTPPCADLIIECGFKRVVVGTIDTSAKVAGRGIDKMRQAGIEVITGVMEKDCRELNKRFFTWHEKKRPYVILKWARSADGFIDLERKKGEPAEPHWITGMTERVLVHRWRAAEDAIIAGGGTIRTDNPYLDSRLWNGKNPVRIIITKSGNIDPGANVFKPTADRIVFTSNSKINIPGVGVILLRDDENAIKTVLNSLYHKNILSVFVEGGSYIIGEFVKSGLWDEARRFTGKMNFNGGVKDPFPEMKYVKSFSFESDTLDIGFNYNV